MGKSATQEQEAEEGGGAPGKAEEDPVKTNMIWGRAGVELQDRAKLQNRGKAGLWVEICLAFSGSGCSCAEPRQKIWARQYSAPRESGAILGREQGIPAARRI